MAPQLRIPTEVYANWLIVPAGTYDLHDLYHERHEHMFIWVGSRKVRVDLQRMLDWKAAIILTHDAYVAYTSILKFSRDDPLYRTVAHLQPIFTRVSIEIKE